MSASQIKLQMGICQIHAFNDLMKQKNCSAFKAELHAFLKILHLYNITPLKCYYLNRLRQSYSYLGSPLIMAQQPFIQVIFRV